MSRLLLAGFCVAILVFATQSLELARPAGIDFTHRNSPTSQKYLIETMGGGVALLDYNNDGLLDIFFVNGGKLSDPVKMPANFSRRDPAYWNRLYRATPDRDLAFIATHPKKCRSFAKTYDTFVSKRYAGCEGGADSQAPTGNKPPFSSPEGWG